MFVSFAVQCLAFSVQNLSVSGCENCSSSLSDDLHNLPIGQKGNYQDYVKGMEARGMAPLREVETQAIRIHAFGNPLKIDRVRFGGTGGMGEFVCMCVSL